MVSPDRVIDKGVPDPDRVSATAGWLAWVQPGDRYRSSRARAIRELPERSRRTQLFGFPSATRGRSAETARSAVPDRLGSAPGSAYKASGTARLGFSGSTSTGIRVPSSKPGVFDPRWNAERTLYVMPAYWSS